MGSWVRAPVGSQHKGGLLILKDFPKFLDDRWGNIGKTCLSRKGKDTAGQTLCVLAISSYGFIICSHTYLF